MIRPRLQHRRPVRTFQPQQRGRHPNVIVKTRLAPEHGQLLPQHRRHQFLGRRLAVGPAHRNHRQLKLPSIRRRHPAKRRAHIVHRQKCQPRRHPLRLVFLHHGRSRPFGRDFRQKNMTVMILTLDGKEHVTGLQQLRIRDRIPGQSFRLTVPQRRPGRCGDKFQISYFHNNNIQLTASRRFKASVIYDSDFPP